MIFFIIEYHNDVYTVDPTTFLPNYKTHNEHIKRTWYITLIYKIATKPYLSFENDTIDYGNQLPNNHSSLEMKWFHGNQFLKDEMR